MTVDLRDEWRCEGCKVAVYVPGKKIRRPRLWQSDDECNHCWVQAAGNDEAETERLAQVAKRRRRKRAPAGITDAAAMTWKKTKQQEKKRRAKQPRKRPADSKIAKAEAEMIANPTRSNREIAALVGLAGQAGIRSARRRLGIPAPKLDRRGNQINQPEPS